MLKLSRIQKSFFTRDRAFTFQRLTLFIINLVRKTLQIEVSQFTENLGIENVSKQAFSKARKKLNPIVFKLLNEKFVTEYYTDNDITTFQGFRILAIDGSKIQLPSSDEIIHEYGSSRSQYGNAIPMAQASIMFDVLNKTMLHSLIAPINTAERDLAVQHLDKLSELQNQSSYHGDKIKDLMIYDRGYPSTGLLVKHTVEKRDFVFRCQKSFVPQLATMIVEGKNDAIFTIKVFDPSRKKSFRERIINLLPGIDQGIEIKIRVVLFTLDSGALEILVTSLLNDKEFTREILFELYNLRWGTEENNKHLKSIAQLENFSGKSKISVEQDFYATVFTCNIANMLAQEVIDEIRSTATNRELKYEYVVNKNIAIGILKDDLIHVLLSEQEMHIFCNKVKQLMAKSLVPIRKNRRFSRKKSVSRKYPTNCRKSI